MVLSPFASFVLPGYGKRSVSVCGSHFIVNSHSQRQKLIFVPCGRCETCMDAKKAQWSFRLRVELDFCRQQHWHIGFFTLTYDDEHLPRLPECVYKSTPPDVGHSCFSRYHVRNFIDNIRKDVHRKFKVTSLRYMVCSEFGSSEHTRRPHYHGIVCFPPSIDPRYMFGLVKRYWRYGFVFPKDFLGGVDSHGYVHHPFLVDGDTELAAKYAAKYCCKDIGFYKSVECFELVDKHDDNYVVLKDCLPFHLQSKSIGLQYLSSLSNSELLKLLEHGESFIGQTKAKALPIYIKDKILFDLRYEFVDGSSMPSGTVGLDWSWSDEKQKFVYNKAHGQFFRKIIRDPSRFLLENYRDVYRLKREYYVDLFTQMQSSSYWYNRKVDPVAADRISLAMQGVDSSFMADYYLAYYGVARDCWNSHIPAVQWLNRYGSEIVSQDSAEPWDFADDFTAKVERYGATLHFVLEQFRHALTFNKQHRDDVRRVHDWYSHLT